MAIVRWDPMKEFEDLQKRFSSLFPAGSYGSFPDFNEALTRAEWSPAVDISETPEAYAIQAELPDVRKEDIKLTVKDGLLTLMGERKFEKEEKNKKFHRVERSYGRFQRSFTLPTAVDEKKVSATYANGVLNVMVPKAAVQTSAAHEVKIS